jgi:hypothetical protein
MNFQGMSFYLYVGYLHVASMYLNLMSDDTLPKNEPHSPLMRAKRAREAKTVLSYDHSSIMNYNDNNFLLL